MVTMPLGQAVSDTDVYLIKAEEVTFEEEKITIVGSARIKMVVQGQPRLGVQGAPDLGPTGRMGILQGGQGRFRHPQT